MYQIMKLTIEVNLCNGPAEQVYAILNFFSLMKCDKQCQSYCALKRLLLISRDIALSPGPVTQNNTLQLVSPIPWMGF